MVEESPDRDRRGRWWLAVGVILAGTVTATILVAADGDDPPAPDKALAELRAFLAQQLPGRFEGTVTGLGDEPDKGGAVETFSGQFDAAGRGSYRYGDGDSANEGIYVDGGNYWDASEGGGPTPASRWRWKPLPDPPAEVFEIGMPTFLSFLSRSPGGSTTHNFAAVHHLAGPLDRLERLHGRTYRAAVDVSDLPPDAQPVWWAPTAGTVEVTIGRGGRLERARWQLQADRADQRDVTIDTRFSAWGRPVVIDLPTPETIDPTPEVYEGLVARFDAAPILAPAPTAVPARWVLHGAYPEPARGGGCPTLQLWYESAEGLTPRLPSARQSDTNRYGYLGLTVSAAGCGTDPATAPGGGAGETAALTVVVGATRVTAQTSLPQADLARILDTLAPLDLAAQPLYRTVPPR